MRPPTLLSAALFLLPLLPLAIACEPVYGDLGQSLDPSTPFEGAAETYLFGGGATTDMVIFGDQDADNIGDIAYATVKDDGEITLLTGTYRAPDSETVQASFTISYHYDPEYDVPASSRVGSTTTLLDVPIEYSGMILMNPDEITLETEGGPRTFTRVGRVMERIDPATPEGEILLARLTNYAVVVSVSRVIGFGSAGLTMYLGRVGEFQGLQSGRQEVEFGELLTPKATFTYVDYTDLTGFHYDGSYTSRTDLSATGDMVGTVAISLTPDADGVPLFSGNLLYDNVLINNGVPDDGFYRFELDGGLAFDVAAPDFNNLDLRGLFP